MSRESRLAAAAALLGLLGASVSLAIDPRTLLIAYLAMAVAVTAIPVGALAVLMVSYLVRGAWTEGLHRPLAAAARTIPLAGLMFIPVLAGMPLIYPWVQQPAGAPGSFKAVYLAAGFFAGRTVLYFVLWSVLAHWVCRSWAHPQRMVASASAGLIVYSLTASLAGIDWLESLTPEFHSSIYGLLFLTFQLLAGLAFAVAIALSQRDAPTHRYGAILLSALLLWAYNHAMQYIIIWAGNVPDEALWYSRREAGIWGVVLWALIVLQFILPFFAMLSESVRNGRVPLLAIAALTLALRCVEAALLALPGMEGARALDGAALMLALPGTIAFLGATWWLGFRFAFARLPAEAGATRAPTQDFDASGSPVSSARGG